MSPKGLAHQVFHVRREDLECCAAGSWHRSLVEVLECRRWLIWPKTLGFRFWASSHMISKDTPDIPGYSQMITSCNILRFCWLPYASELRLGEPADDSAAKLPCVWQTFSLRKMSIMRLSWVHSEIMSIKWIKSISCWHFANMALGQSSGQQLNLDIAMDAQIRRPVLRLWNLMISCALRAERAHVLQFTSSHKRIHHSFNW